MNYLHSIFKLAGRFSKIAGELKTPNQEIVNQIRSFYLESFFSNYLDQTIDNYRVFPTLEKYWLERMNFTTAQYNSQLNTPRPNIDFDPVEGWYAVFPLEGMPYNQDIKEIEVTGTNINYGNEKEVKQTNVTGKKIKYVAVVLDQEDSGDPNAPAGSFKGVSGNYIFTNSAGKEMLLLGAITLNFAPLPGFNLELPPPGMSRGQYEESIKLMMDNWFIDLHRQAKNIEQTINHELRHLIQFFITCLNNYRQHQNFSPFVKGQSTVKWTGGLPRTKKEPTLPGVAPANPFEAYLLRDEEFYNWLSDEIEKFKQSLRYVPPAAREVYMKVFLSGSRAGMAGYAHNSKELKAYTHWLTTISNDVWGNYDTMTPDLNQLSGSSFFAVLRDLDPGKWKKAVKEFTKAVEPYL